jgi:hypothetical protein
LILRNENGLFVFVVNNEWILLPSDWMNYISGEDMTQGRLFEFIDQYLRRFRDIFEK